MRVVVDNNVLISALLRTTSVPGQLFSSVNRGHVHLLSEAALAELVRVLARPKFRKYIDFDQAAAFIGQLTLESTVIHVTVDIHDCRDPKDDKFLALALAGAADLIVSGDDDLLVLHPWRGIPILTPAEALVQLAS